ncbi:MAG: hypothetical protein ACRDOU_11710 [Streptosporangiaceae bacterium]
MKFRTVMVAGAVAALSFAAAGPAAAQTLGHPVQRVPASSPQVTGARLLSGLLSPSAFGNGFTFGASLNSGGKLASTHANKHVSGMSCSAFEGSEWVTGFGNTAGAAEEYKNPSPGNVALDYGFEDVLQFASTAAAATYFNQADTKYTSCREFTEPNPGDTRPGGGTYQVNVLGVSKTTVRGDRGYKVTQQIAESERPGVTLYINVLYVVAGANVYSLWQVNGTNDEPSTTAMGSLIHRIQGLY